MVRFPSLCIASSSQVQSMFPRTISLLRKRWSHKLPIFYTNRNFWGSRKDESINHSRLIIDTRKKDDTKSSTDVLDKDLRDLLKNKPPSFQIDLLESYRRGMKDGKNVGPNTKSSDKLTVLLKIGIVFTGVYLIMKMLERVLGGAIPKVFESSVVSFATDTGVTFKDVQGCEEVKKELQDVVEFLKNPSRFNKIGAKLPKGVLLIGQPGIGKTLLAKAVSGEAQVPFLHISGSNFEELFVGVGAARVRQLFATAKRNAPCLIFIDEIDSVGRNRTNSPHYPYANQTINQLLAEMDGFTSTEGIIVLGATNQVHTLDKALLRPGRFDVHINVSPPNYEGRVALLNLYLSKTLCSPNIDVEKLAHGTVGYTGADIRNLVNQAAITAGLRNESLIEMNHLWEARDRLIMGPAKRRPLDEETNKVSAYHEAGHALVALLTPDSTPLHKVTIIPRGDAGGHTSFLQDKDISFWTRSQLLAQLDVLMGGRVGEELAFGIEKVTTGAGDDLKKATTLAQNIVSHYGLSSKFGPRVLLSDESGKEEVGQTTRDLIDKEVDTLLQDSIARVRALLSNHTKQHKQLAEALLHYETLSKDEVTAVLNGKLSYPNPLKVQNPPSDPNSPIPILCIAADGSTTPTLV